LARLVPYSETCLLFYSSYNIHWNYGLLPQTWEDPSLANHEVEGAFGDNDPGIPKISIYVISISCRK
jgi:inorganic pyrophosphatase